MIDTYQLCSRTFRALGKSAALNSMDKWIFSAPHAFERFQTEVLVNAEILQSKKMQLIIMSHSQ
jgi:hypothetical protein